MSRPGPGNDLQELLPELRGFVDDAEPALADLDRTLVHPGRRNDLRTSRRRSRRLAIGGARHVSGGRVNPAAVPYEGNNKSVRGRSRAVGRTPGAFPEITDATSRRGAAHRASAGPTRPSSGAGSTTSRTRAGTTRSAGSTAPTSCSTSRSLFNDSTAQIDAAGSPAFFQTKKCPGSAEAPAADESNVFSRPAAAPVRLRGAQTAPPATTSAGDPFVRRGEGGIAPRRGG